MGIKTWAKVINFHKFHIGVFGNQGRVDITSGQEKEVISLHESNAVSVPSWRRHFRHCSEK